MSAAIALFLFAAAAKPLPSCEKEFGGPCCLASAGRPPAALVRAALQAVATAELAAAPGSDRPIDIVAAPGLSRLSTRRAWKWAPSMAKLRARWRPGAHLPFLYLEVDKGAFRDRQGHPAVLVGSLWAVVKGATAKTEPVGPDELQGGATSYCVSSLADGLRVSIDHTAEN
jgi:hypothetical protein